MKRLMILASCCLIAMSSFAQQQLGQRPRVKSPVINADGTVTFNLYAPSAQRVSVSGDFEEIHGKRLDMTKQENGVWTVTTEALNPELYSYSISVDGQRFIDPGNSYVNRDISTLSNIFIVTKSADDKGHLYSVNDVPHGTLSRVWYDSPTLGQQRRMTVYLPAAYDGKKSFPVMYLLHGHGGDETAWGDLGRASQIMDNLIAQGKALPMIVVMPNGHPAMEAAPGESSWGLYKPFHSRVYGGDGTFEKHFAEIMAWAESEYRIQADKQHRAIAGLSMGGGHTNTISRLYRNTFDYVGLFSAGLIRSGRGKFYDNMDQLLQQQIKDGVKLYWVGCGKEDFLYKSVQDHLKLLEKYGQKYTYRESGDGHVWKNWRIYLSEFAPLLFK